MGMWDQVQQRSSASQAWAGDRAPRGAAQQYVSPVQQARQRMAAALAGQGQQAQQHRRLVQQFGTQRTTTGTQRYTQQGVAGARGRSSAGGLNWGSLDGTGDRGAYANARPGVGYTPSMNGYGEQRGPSSNRHVIGGMFRLDDPGGPADPANDPEHQQRSQLLQQIMGQFGGDGAPGAQRVPSNILGGGGRLVAGGGMTSSMRGPSGASSPATGFGTPGFQRPSIGMPQIGQQGGGQSFGGDLSGVVNSGIVNEINNPDAISPQEQALMQSRLADDVASARTAREREIREDYGRRGLGGSDLEAAALRQAASDADTQRQSGTRDLSIERALAREGSRRAGLGLGVNMLGLQEGNRRSDVAMLLQLLDTLSG